MRNCRADKYNRDVAAKMKKDMQLLQFMVDTNVYGVVSPDNK